MRACALLAFVASCGFPKLPPLTGDGGGGSDGTGPACAGCVLAAVTPAMAPAGATITLEGKFVDPTMVSFPGGVTAQATLLDGGTNRATVTVPIGATTGVITVGDASVPFRTTTFLPTLGDFSDQFDQADYARATPSLVANIDGAATAVIGDQLYVIGGETQGTTTAAIEVATINADGTLGPFSAYGNTLIDQRSGATTTLIGNTLYVVGGLSDSGTVLRTIEAATVMPDNSLAEFTLASSTLTTKRYGQTTQVIGNLLYVIGGHDEAMGLETIETATIGSEGVLGPFTAAGSLPADPRYGATSVVVGDTLYVLGGQASPTLAFDNFVQAPINGDGTLGSFTMPTTTHMNAMRVGATSTALDGTLYVIGGAVSAGGGSFASTIDASVIGSDGTLGEFLTSPNQLVTARGGYASAVVGNHLYVLGGLGVGGATGTDLSGIERASLLPGGLGTFTELTPTLGIARHGHASAVIGNYYYVLGGKDTQGAIRNNVERAQFAADGTLGSFSDAALLEIGRFEPSSAVIGDRLYVIGGETMDYPQGTAEVEYATIASDGSLSPFQDDTSTSSLMTGRYGATTVVFDDNIFVLGGMSANGVEQTVEVASFASGDLGSFEAINPLLDTAVASASGAAIGGDVCMFGGSNSSVIQTAGYKTTGTFDPFSEPDLNTLLDPLTAPTNIFIGNVLYVIGGMSGTAELGDIEMTTVGRYGDVGSVSAAASQLMVPRDGHSSTVVGNFVYVFGGRGSSGILGSIEQAMLQ